jgi:hypothetical protein
LATFLVAFLATFFLTTFFLATFLATFFFLAGIFFTSLRLIKEFLKFLSKNEKPVYWANLNLG